MPDAGRPGGGRLPGYPALAPGSLGFHPAITTPGTREATTMGMKRRRGPGRPKVNKPRDPYKPGPDEYGGGIITTPPDIMSKREAACYLKISPPTLDELRRQGRIRWFQYGARSVRFRKSDLDTYVDKLVREQDRRRKSVRK